LAGHAVERAQQLPGLVARAALDVHGEVAVRHPLRGGHRLAQRPA
jgi:hypothetical protein